MTTNWEKIRSNFPALKTYCYLNSAEASPISNDAYKAANLYYKEIMNHGDLLYEKWMEQIENTRNNIAHYINANPDEIAFTTNTSLGMNYISYMLKNITKNQNNILSMKDEFPSSTLPWLNNKYKISFVKDIKLTYPIKHIKKYINNNTKILVSSHVQYATGFRQDITKLNKLAKQHQLYTVINATQSFGVFPINVKEMKIDFLVSTGLKWAMAGYGVGIIFISKKMQEKCNTPICGWKSNKNPMLMKNNYLNIKNNASALETGSPNISPILALGETIKLFKTIGQNNITQRIIELSNYTIQKLKTKHIISPINKEKYKSGIIIIKLNNPEKIRLILKKQNIIVSKRKKGLRISFHIYNSKQDIDKLITALKPYI